MEKVLDNLLRLGCIVLACYFTITQLITYSKNEDLSLVSYRKLKFDLTILDIKIKKERPIDVAKINPEATDSAAIDYAVMLELETEMTRTELEHELQPDYKILKLKEI